MNTVKIRITEFGKEVEMIKLIRVFDRTVPLSEIKRRLAEKDAAVIFDFDAYDWLDETEHGITAYDYDRRILTFISELEKTDASFEIIHDNEVISKAYLENYINRSEEIRKECEEYPD